MEASAREQLTGTFFWVTTQTESAPRTPIDVTPADFTALNAYSGTRNGTGQMDYKSAPDLRSDEGEGKKKARVLGEALTDLVQASLGGEDGDVAVVARARSAAHLAGRRKISPELGVVREQGLCVLCASATSGTRIYTPPRPPLLIPQEEEKIARSGPTPTLSLRWDPGPTRV
jgi:hypothetical protein